MTTTASCCSTQRPQGTTIPNFLKAPTYRTLETVYRVAIGIFAAITLPTYFFTALAIGATATLLHHAWHAWKEKPEERIERNRPLCTQGYMEMLSNRRYHDELNLTVTSLFIGAHTRCMPHFYVPLCGVTLGIWTIDLLVDAGKRFPLDADDVRDAWQHGHIV